MRSELVAEEAEGDDPEYGDERVNREGDEDGGFETREEGGEDSKGYVETGGRQDLHDKLSWAFEWGRKREYQQDRPWDGHFLPPQGIDEEGEDTEDTQRA